MRKMLALGVVLGGLGSGLGARGAERRTWLSFSPTQTAVSAGGGVADFVGSTMRANARPGADWDLRLTFGTASPIAFEAGYTGLYHALSSSSGSGAPHLVQNALDGALRVNLFPWRVTPFIFGGVGYNHVDVVHRDALAVGWKASDDQLLIPVGGGVAAFFGNHILVEARFTYRAIFYDQLIIDNPSARQDSYTVAARVGYVF